MNNISKFFGHFKTVCTHKYWVYHFCKLAGIPKQGLLHDLSKFSPIEFWESVKYYSGDRSPIDNCKEVNNYSEAWLHHKGKNKHHYEYWQDNFTNGTMKSISMPVKYEIEMLCDYLGAAVAYKRNKCPDKEFRFADEWVWWIEKQKKKPNYHPNQIQFIDYCLRKLCEVEEEYGYEAAENLLKNIISNYYKNTL